MRATGERGGRAPDDRASRALQVAGLVAIEWNVGRDGVSYAGATALLFSEPPHDHRLADLLENFDDRDREELERRLRTLAERGGTIELEARRPLPDGEEQTLAGRAQAHGDERGITGVLAVLADVTATRRCTAELAARAHRYREVFDRLPLPVGLATPEGKLVAYNRAMLTPGGYQREDMERIGGNVAALYRNPADRDRIIDQVRRDGSVHRYEVEFLRKDGSPYLAALSLVPLTLDAERLQMAVVEDLSERRQLQEQLLRAQKLEAIGRLAGGIAHDFNNLVTVIVGYAEHAGTELPPRHPAHASLSEITHAGERAAELTAQLLAFARRRMIQPQVIGLGDLVRETERMLRRVIGERIELTTAIAPDLWPVSVDPGQIEQVLVNLAVNARDAMPEGGRFSVELRNVELALGHPRHEAMAPGDYLLLTVSDTGVGMTPEVRDRAFEPFFTTKEPGQGSGLGLATCYGIIKQARGYIWVESELAQGTSFELYLPRAASSKAEPRPQSQRPPEARRGGEVVLLVEDEPQVNELSARALRARGYTVLAARNAAAALELARGETDVAALVTDVVLPGMSGLNLAERLIDRRPGLRVLYVSGYANSRDVREASRRPGSAFLHKPFTPTQLLAELRKLLDLPSPSL